MEKFASSTGAIRAKRVFSWYTNESTTGAKLLTMPNIPRPLSELNPRNMLGKDCWNKMRKECFKKARYKCEACGKILTSRGIQSHELYSYCYLTGTASFIRCVCLCEKCHKGIHSGHTVSEYKRGNISKNELLDIMEHVFKIIYEYNSSQLNQKTLLVYKSFLSCLHIPELQGETLALIKKYGIEFYCEDRNLTAHWSEWHLSFGGSVFPPIHKTKKSWLSNATRPVSIAYMSNRLMKGVA